jgi:hypothetical protein
MLQTNFWDGLGVRSGFLRSRLGIEGVSDDHAKLVLISQVHHSILLKGKMSGQRAGLKGLNASF